MKKEMLETIANTIEVCFTKNNLPVHVTGGVISFRWIQFNLIPLIKEKQVNLSKLSEEISKILNAEFVRLSSQGGIIHIEIPNREFKPIPLISILSKSNGVSSTTATLGVTKAGKPLIVELTSQRNSHILILGDEEAGKTNLIRAIIFSLSMNRPLAEISNGLEFVLIGDIFDSSYNIPSINNTVVTRDEDIIEMVKSLVHLGKQRLNGSTRTFPLVVIIDDADLIVGIDDRGIKEDLLWLVCNGNTVDMFIIVSSEYKFNAPLSILYDSFPLRIIGKANNEKESSLPSWMIEADASHLLGHGDFVAMAEDRLYPFQAAYVPQDKKTEILKELTKKRSLVERKMLAGFETTA